jgi:hypothetical protein
MANTMNAGVHKEDWAVALQRRLNKPSNWKEIADVKYSDNYIINNPYMATEFGAQTGTRGTAYGFEDFTLTNSALTIDQKDVVPVFVDRADMAQITYVNQMEIATRQGALLDDVVETAMLADHASWTDVGDVSGTVTSGNTTQFTVSSTNIDNIVRGVRRIVAVANGREMMDEKGLFFVWRPADMEALEQYAQANGFNLADLALEKGIPAKGYYYLGAYHYTSNSHTANHVFAGVRKVFMIGILRTTYGQIVVTQDPNLQSGTGIIARVDHGVLSPAGLTTILYDVNVV